MSATTTWIVVLGTAAATMALKAVGPVLLGGRPLPARLTRIVTLLGPALLAALVATATFAVDRDLVVDERLAGVAAAGVALLFRAPVLIVVVIAAATTGLLRAFV
ncbi:MAG TPA: AzlD domain-containing protein [Actinomycetota bacterium]|nr:AzlD domain-containing protein [Actinomycetota bacterium]